MLLSPKDVLTPVFAISLPPCFEHKKTRQYLFQDMAGLVHSSLVLLNCDYIIQKSKRDCKNYFSKPSCRPSASFPSASVSSVLLPFCSPPFADNN